MAEALEGYVSALATKVFISHNSLDKEVAREIAMFLVAENIGVWFDEWTIEAGDSIVGEIEQGLNNCTYFLIVWSHHAAKSDWVRRELRSTLAGAINNSRPRVIPIRVDDAPLPPLLRDLKYLRYRDGSETERLEVIDTVAGHAPSKSFIRAVVKKYHEVIGTDSPEGLWACPECGSTRIKFTEVFDEESYKHRVVVDCPECGWGALWA